MGLLSKHRRVIDQKAETIREMTADTGMSREWCRRQAAENISAGRWELVWKRVGGHLLPAYRLKK